MGKIIGEQFRSYVSDQINTRQKAHGSGADGTARTLNQLSYLNSKTAWVKLASGVFVSGSRSVEEFGSTEGGKNSGDVLAKKNVLFGGTSNMQGSTSLTQRGTYDDSPKNIYDFEKGTYNVKVGEEPSEFGLVPMPGIESVDVKSLNRGSIKRATVNIKCYSPEQFQIIDLLYLRIGYTVFLEWGNSLYMDGDKLIEMGYTLTESEGGFFSDRWKDSSYSGFLPAIEAYRRGKKGNYDGLLAKVVNFSWTFSQDGSYNIELQLISLGDVVESLKLNITPSYSIAKSIRDLYTLYKEDDTAEEDTEISPSPADNMISAYLFYQKLLVDKKNNTDTGYDASTRQDNNQIESSINDVPISLGSSFVKKPKDGTINFPPVQIQKSGFDSKEEGEEWIKSNYPDAKKYNNLIDLNDGTEGDKYIVTEYQVYVKSFPKLDIDIEQGDKDVVYLNYNEGQTDEDAPINDAGFYMRLGHFIDFANAYVIPRIDNANFTPIISVDSGQWDNKMYTLPYQVSLDPRVCIVRPGEKISKKEYFKTLIPWKNPDYGYAWTMNIYVSHNQIIASLNENTDEKGNVSLFDFFNSICVAINKAMGGINNLEPFLDEDTNTLHIIDGSYHPPTKSKYSFELFGYNSKNPNQKSIVSNFVRNFDLKTEITNEFATMATIGATAGGYVKGTENTMFSKWNRGLIDRWKEKYVAADPDSRSKSGDVDEPNKMYVEEFYRAKHAAFGWTLKDVVDDAWTKDKAGLNTELIEKNIATVTEFYKYVQAEIQKTKPKYSSPSNGFIPISLTITMDGLSGIKIYNEINVITRFLPKNYPDNLRFIIKGVNHKLTNSDWETTIETVVIAQTEDKTQNEAKPIPILDYAQIKTEVDRIIGTAGEFDGESITPGSIVSNILESIGAPGSSADTIVAGTPSGDYIKIEDLSKRSQSFIKSTDRITLVREWTNGTRTSGTLWYKGEVLGFTVEDPVRSKKIQDRTAIPKGNFNVVLDTTGNKNLVRCYVTFPDGKGSFKSPGVLPRVGSDKNAVSLEAYNQNFAGIRIHNGTDEGWSSGCIIYSSKREKDGKVKNDLAHNKALTKLIYDNNIKFITVTQEWDNTTSSPPIPIESPTSPTQAGPFNFDALFKKK
jgi:hypothetical protein